MNAKKEEIETLKNTAMKCPRCGKEIANDSVFCEYCGERISRSEVSSKSPVKSVILGVCALLVAFMIGFYVLNPSYFISSSKESPNLTYVDNMTWDSPIGKALYSGYVVHNIFLGKVPHTNGIANIIQGRYAGCTYEGEFNMGKMDGRAKYTLSNGDIFVGEFKDGQYDKGKYIVASSGKSFEGTFQNGKPDKGHWYDKTGNKK